MTNRRNWLLNEVASAGRENLDVNHVSRYDIKEDAGAMEDLKLLKTLGLNRRSIVVDIGAGTGQFALAAGSECARMPRTHRTGSSPSISLGQPEIRS